MFNVVRTAWFLATKYFSKFSKWTSALIIFVIALTFLNLVVVSGLLVGLIEGSVLGIKELRTGEVFITPTEQNQHIKKYNELFSVLDNNKNIKGYAPRYVSDARLYKDYKTSIYRRAGEVDVDIYATVTGIDIEKEKDFFELDEKIIEGRWFVDTDVNSVILGNRLTASVDEELFTDERVLGDVKPGEIIEIQFENNTSAPQKFQVIGIINSKQPEYDYGIIIPSRELRGILGQSALLGPDNIGVRISNNVEPAVVIDSIKASTDSTLINVRSAEDSIGKYLGNIRKTFVLLSNALGTISIVVVTVMLFIVIFISAITKQRQIGILKGIGISPLTLKLSYMFLSFMYTFVGVVIGVLILVFLLIPYFDANPIDFPFSDGILFVTLPGLITKIFLLFVMSIFAGFLPAHLITRRNTLNTILGR